MEKIPSAGNETIEKIPELLAPAGQVESFAAAIENGANAVYLGLNRLSARAHAANFSFDDLSTLVPYAHHHNVSVYAAVNSAITASEVPGVLDMLQSLSDLKVDALIAQDPGIFFLARKYFPDLKLHASTLMALHNSAGVNSLERMGAKRAVLARELSLKEIEQIASSSKLELELFVHGALCYSFSGMCMASSFRGGHSGLQGRCVQPCRLKFRQGRNEGFFLSCNDFCALPLIPKLKRLRLASLKIEGRMKSSDYVAQVVKAYRIVLDAEPKDEPNAVAQAQDLLSRSPSRRLTKGFLSDDFNAEVLTPHRSGSSGLWVGSVKSAQRDKVLVQLRHELRVGDRLRPESSAGKEKEVLTVSAIFSPDGAPLEEGRAGDRVLLLRKGEIQVEDRLFKIGSKTMSASNVWQKIKKNAPKRQSYRKHYPRREDLTSDWPHVSINLEKSEESLILKIDAANDLTKAFQVGAQRVMLTASHSNLERMAKQRLGPAQKDKFVWSLPALITEKDMAYYRAAVEWFREKGFTRWEVNNWGHFDFFVGGGRVQMIAGYRFNIRNAAALAEMAAAGCRLSVLSLEITREELQVLSRGPLGSIPIICFYVWPPLFTSRLLPRLQEEKPFVTPRREPLFFRKKGEFSFIYGERPMNWSSELASLRDLGYRHFLLDLTGGPHPQTKDLEKLIAGYRQSRAYEPFSLFNLNRKPLPD